jgi:DNA-binding MarR family transcriptional regulator
MTLNGLASELFLDKSTASRVVGALQKRGYVERSASPSDGRALQIDVTQQGRDLHARIERELVDEMSSLIADFDPDVRQATTRLVARLARAATLRFGQGGREAIPERK